MCRPPPLTRTEAIFVEGTLGCAWDRVKRAECVEAAPLSLSQPAYGCYSGWCSAGERPPLLRPQLSVVHSSSGNSAASVGDQACTSGALQEQQQHMDALLLRLHQVEAQLAAERNTNARLKALSSCAAAADEVMAALAAADAPTCCSCCAGAAAASSDMDGDDDDACSSGLTAGAESDGDEEMSSDDDDGGDGDGACSTDGGTDSDSGSDEESEEDDEEQQLSPTDMSSPTAVLLQQVGQLPVEASWPWSGGVHGSHVTHHHQQQQQQQLGQQHLGHPMQPHPAPRVMQQGLLAHAHLFFLQQQQQQHMLVPVQQQHMLVPVQQQPALWRACPLYLASGVVMVPHHPGAPSQQLYAHEQGLLGLP